MLSCRRASLLALWLGLAAVTPLASRVVWLGLAASPSSGCYGLGDGASIASFSTVVLDLALALEPSGLVCVAPALVLPLVGLVALLRREAHPGLGGALSVLGFVAHALTAVALVGAGC